MKTLDISRLLEQPEKRYVGVRLGQGRILLDGDASDQQYLADADRRHAITDLVGYKGSPDEGFSLGGQLPALTANWPEQTEILQTMDLLVEEQVDLGGTLVPVRPVSVRAGTFFLAGMRLVMEEAEHIAMQRDFLQLKPGDLPALPEATEEDPEPVLPMRALYVLHAWEQTVSAAEDEELLEQALGEETTGRLRTMRRVEVFSDLSAGEGTCARAFRKFRWKLQGSSAVLDERTCELKSLARLTFEFVSDLDRASCGECLPASSGSFLGADHQTLRIQLIENDRYVYAFDNASDLYRVAVSGLDGGDPEAPIIVRMVTPPKSVADFVEEGRVVEVVPFGAVLDGDVPEGLESPFFGKVADRLGAFARVERGYDAETETFTLELGAGIDQMRDFVSSWDPRHPAASKLNLETAGDTRYFYLRVWHKTEPNEPLSFSIYEKSRLPGTDLVPVFLHEGRPGDYWVVSSRPGTRYPATPFDLTENPAGVPPHGPRDFYAPLGLVKPLLRDPAEPDDEDRVGSAEDCRPPITRLSDRGCVTFSVGDGFKSRGDFQSIQEAIDALPENGGVIQLLQGTFRERVRLIGQKNLTIEGCGTDVVWETPYPRDDPLLQESPLPEGPYDLISIEQSEGITVRGITMHSVDDVAVHVHDGSFRITLEALALRSGERVGDTFRAGAKDSGVPLLLLDGGHSVHCRRVVAEAQVRPTIFAQGCDRMVLEELTLAGVASGSAQPFEPMVDIVACGLLTFRNSVLSAFGQTGVRLSDPMTSDAELRDVAVVVGLHRRVGDRAMSPGLSGIAVEGAQRVKINQCTVTMDESASDHAGIVVQGTDIQVEGSRVEALYACFDAPKAGRSPAACDDFRPAAWGGIHIRGGSVGISVRQNRIVGGVGHGVTLGSVGWADTAGATYYHGAGRGQIASRRDSVAAATGDLRGRLIKASRELLLPASEGALQDIQIVGNRIEQMNGNGVSVLSVLGMPGSSDLVEVVGLRVAGNTIVGNLRAPYDQMDVSLDVGAGNVTNAGEPAAVQLLPAGGVVLGAAQNVDIVGNVISNNGTDGRIPTNGVFILCGDGIQIANNRITGNGGRAPVHSATQPSAGLEVGVRAGIAVVLAGTGNAGSLLTLRELVDELGGQLESDGSSLRVMNNTVRHPEGRALFAVATGPLTVEGNALASEGNHGADTFADARQIGDVVFVMNLGHPWETELGPIDAGNYTSYDTSGSDVHVYMDIERPVRSPQGFVGQGGRLLFHNNQVQMDWEVRRTPALPRTPIAFFPVALITLDHLGADNNQFLFRLRDARPGNETFPRASTVRAYQEPVIAQVLTIAATSNLTGNRFSEALGHTILSACSLSYLLNVFAFNQSTHETFVANEQVGSESLPQSDTTPAKTNPPHTTKSQNQVLFKRSDSFPDDVAFAETLRRFIALVWRPA